MESGIKQARKQALNSSYKYRMGAVIVKSGRVLSTGYNVIGHKSTQRQYPSIHAEEAAIVKLLKQPNGLRKLAGSTIYITRILKNGTCGLAKPCPKCQSLINSVGIKKIVHT